jgi:hypothetical protein
MKLLETVDEGLGAAQLPAFRITRFSVPYGTENLLLLLRKLRGLLVCLRHAQLHSSATPDLSAQARQFTVITRDLDAALDSSASRRLSN